MLADLFDAIVNHPWLVRRLVTDHHAGAHLLATPSICNDAFVNVKASLPFPYNLDLSPVLQGLARRTMNGRRKLANDPVTAAYLAAGMRLLERHTSRVADGEAGGATTERPLLRLLSQRAVADEVANNPDPFVRIGTTTTLRSTWVSQPHYVADLLRFGLWAQRYIGLYTEDLETHVENLVAGPRFVEAINATTYAHLADGIERPRFRLQLLAAAMAEDDEVIRQAMTDNYREVEDTWLPVFTAMMQQRGLRLRPDITLRDFTALIVAAVEGVALRAIADKDATVRDPVEGTNLVGVFGMALLLGCTQRITDDPHVTLTQAVEELVNDAPADD
jgi:AcrR family transcriptional regulator